jgi:hypothetical protein
VYHLRDGGPDPDGGLGVAEVARGVAVILLASGHLLLLFEILCLISACAVANFTFKKLNLL